ncbi:MAG TPA: hypothetical protein VMV49_13905 [Candidatus Deferrimicrobium sp.]|nr:hypothetical protein [Candidatus Deferrimicrobium sp.]
MPFIEDDAVEIASEVSEAKKFEEKYPDCVWNVEKMKPKDTEAWIKKHPKVAIAPSGKEPPKSLWLVELEELEKEKLVLIISPLIKKVVDAYTEKLEAEPEEEEEESAEEEE